MLDTRPVSRADSAGALVCASVVLGPGRFVGLKIFVPPVMTGSAVATPEFTRGTNCVPLMAVFHVFTCVKLPPKFSTCADRDHVILAFPCFSGVFRRVWPVVRYGFCSPKPKAGA